jgi:DNA-binding XRE family transcriptional regulator
MFLMAAVVATLAALLALNVSEWGRRWRLWRARLPVRIRQAMTSFEIDRRAPLADVLKEWRIAAHITSTQAARRCGISRQLWFQLETGETKRPLMSTLEKVSQGTGIPLGILEVASYISMAPTVPWPPPSR